MADSRFTSNRRRFLSTAALSAAALATAVPAIAVPAIAAPHGDAAIIAAWERRIAKFREFDARDDWGDNDTQAENDCWAAIDQAELEIIEATATTPLGAEIQVWVALDCTLQKSVDASAARRRDLAHFQAKDAALDWNHRLMVATIRSLRHLGDA